MYFLWFGLAALAWQAQQSNAVPPDVQLLARVKTNVAANLARLPNYTCLQTIERSHRNSVAHRFEPLDRVRLEVALVGGKEMFGWPGGKKIAESEISNLVAGTIGNGDYALLAKSIFQNAAATFRFAGNTALQGKPALKFEYQVPLGGSGYHLKVPPSEAIVPYHGSFWIDPDTFDLMRLQLNVDEIPEYLGLASTSDAMDYSRVEIGGSRFILPSSAELDMIDLAGAESRNETHFASCRQFAGESILSFDAAPVIAPEPAPVPKQLQLPKDFLAALTLDTPIDSSSTAVGDAISAKLRRPIRTGKDTVIPKDAVFTGHVLRLERRNRGYILELAFTSIDDEGSHADLDGRSNLVWLPFSIRDLRLDLGSSRSFDRSYVKISGPITIPADHLKLSPGVRLNLRSRLVQSE